MTPAELKDARKALGLTLSGLAEALRMGKSGRDTIRAWESGDNDRGIPGPAQVAVECLLNHGLQTGLQTGRVLGGQSGQRVGDGRQTKIDHWRT